MKYWSKEYDGALVRYWRSDLDTWDLLNEKIPWLMKQYDIEWFEALLLISEEYKEWKDYFFTLV